MSRIERPFPAFSSSRRSGYNWEKLLEPKALARNKWLGKTWAELYFQNLDDKFLRYLSTDEIMKTKWFEKYGIKEPQF
jgi:hypothetical protein